MGWELLLPTGDVLKVIGTATIGRGPHNHVVLNDTLVSRTHVELLCQGAVLLINDLHSTNGTYVNEVPVSPASSRSIQPGEVLRVGNTRIGVRYTRDDTMTTNPQLSQTRPGSLPTDVSHPPYPGEAIRRPLLPKPAQVLYTSEPRNPFNEIMEILKGGGAKT
jgi:pSer/pThr/pTyr-binding forkhead associated (FHA) protein